MGKNPSSAVMESSANATTPFPVIAVIVKLY